MEQEKRSKADEWVHNHRANWSFTRLTRFLSSGDSVLSLGAGDCRLDALLEESAGCKVTSLDVDNYNETDRHLTLYDGENIPFPNDTFDAVLLLFALHHAVDPKRVLLEAKRVSRRHIIVFEDIVESATDRFVFHWFHRFLRWSQGFPMPNVEWTPEQWSELAGSLGMSEYWRGEIGRSLGYFASRHVAFVWDTKGAPAVEVVPSN